jgi:long-chain acyl-CoA synthetase
VGSVHGSQALIKKFGGTALNDRINEIIVANLGQFQAEPTVWWRNTWWSRGAFLELVEECGRRLAAAGFKEGHRLALLLPNSPLFLAESIAAWNLGGTVVPIDYRGGYVSITKQLKHADVFAAVTFRGAEALVPLISEDGIPCTVSALDAPPETMAGRASAQEINDNAIIFYTSGTTGEAKAVPVTHKGLIANIEGCATHIGELTNDDVFFNVLPNCNALGFVCAGLLPLVKNAGQAVVSAFMPTDLTMEAMRKASVSVVPAVPTMISLFFAAAARGMLMPSTLRYIISGGDRLPAGFDKRAEELLGAPVIEGYGLTEATAVVSMNPGADKRKSGTVGTLLFNVEAEIRDDAGSPLPAGKEGRLWLRGDSIVESYYRDPECTEQRFADGWFDTQDIAKFDGDGYLSIVSRTSDVIFVGGFKVYALEVETALKSHPSVLEAAVVGVPRSISGELVKAFVMLKKGEKVSARELTDFVRKKLAYYKVPRIIKFVNEMPRSNIGEILKRKLEKD